MQHVLHKCSMIFTWSIGGNVAFNDLEFHVVNKEVKQFVDSIRPPKHIRNEVDIVYTIIDQTIDIGEKRPLWNGKSGETYISPSARIKYIRSTNIWKLYWMRRDLKWHLYFTGGTLTELLEVVRNDAHCFFF